MAELPKIFGEPIGTPSIGLPQLPKLFGENTVFGTAHKNEYRSPESTFESRFNTGLIPGINPDQIRRGNQKWYDLVGSAALNSAAEVGLGTLEGAGYLADLEQWKNVMNGSETEFGNWFSDIMKQAKQQIKSDVAPVYTTEQDQGFQPLDGRWWANNFPSVLSSISLMIPALGVTKAATSVGRALPIVGRRLAAFSQPAKQLTKGIVSAGFSRYGEATMEAAETADSTYQAALDSGKSDDEAKSIAGEAASSNYYRNLALIGFDIFQYGKIFKAFSSANAAKAIGKSAIAKNLGEQAISESLEEVLQFITSKESEHAALVNNNASSDKRNFTQRVEDYSKDSNLWTSAFFGAIGGAAFGAVGEYAANKDRDKAAIIANTLKPTVEQEKAVYEGNKTENNIKTDEGFINLLHIHATNGTLDKVKEDLKSYADNLKSMSDEELSQQGVTKESIEALETSRIAQIEKAEQLYNDIAKEGLPQEIKDRKFVLSMANVTSNYRKTEANKELENELTQFTVENKAPVEVTELKRLRAIRNAYIDNKQSQLAIMYNSKIEQLEKQVKEIYPNIDIKEALVSDRTTKIQDNAMNFVTHEINALNTDERLKQLSTKEGIQQAVDEDSKVKELQNENQYNNIIDAVNQNTDLATLTDLERAAEKRGKKEDFIAYKENYINTLRMNAGNLSAITEEALGKRYSNKKMLFEYEMEQLSKRLNTPFLDENVVEQKYLQDPRAKKIIDDYYIEVNNITTKEQSKDEPEFSAVSTPQGTDANIANPEQPSEYEQKSADGIRDPFLSVGKRFNIVKEIRVVNGEAKNVWVTKYNNGNPEPTPETYVNEVNWEEVDKPDFAPKDTIVYYEYNPSSNTNKTFGKEKYNREILQVVYKDGNPINKIEQNRIVIGILSAYKSDLNWSDNNDGIALKNLRENIDNIVKDNKSTNVVDIGISTTIVEKLQGRIWNTGTYNSPKDVLASGEELIFGVGRLINEVPFIDTPQFPSQFIGNNYFRQNVQLGSTYMIVKAANGTYIPVKLFTERLGKFPQLLLQANNILDQIRTNEITDVLTIRRMLDDLVGFPKDHIGFGDGILKVLVDNQWIPLNEDSLKNMIVQVNVNRINKGDYNQKISDYGILKTNINPVTHFHSAKFRLDNKSNININVDESTKASSTNNTTSSSIIGTTSNSFKIEAVNAPKLANFNPDTIRPKVNFEQEYIPWNKTEELKWWNKNLPNVPISVIDNIHEIYKQDGAITFGLFKNASAFIWENAGQGTSYHEAFHAVFNLFLTDKQRQDILNEVNLYKDEITPQINSKQLYPSRKISDTREQIPTSEIFKNTLSKQEIHRLRREIYNAKTSKFEEELVDVNLIISNQEFIKSNYISSGLDYLPRATKIEGKYLLEDGNHRIAHEIIDGKKYVKLNVRYITQAASNNRLEEILADRFAEYIITQQKSEESYPDTLYNRVKKFFKELYSLIKSMFNDNISIDDLFGRINNKYYANKEFVYKDNNYWKDQSVKYKLVIDPRKKQAYVKTINTLFFESIDKIRNDNNDYKDLEDIDVINKWGKKNGQNGVLAIYKSVFNTLVDYNNSPVTDQNSIDIKYALANDLGTGILQNFFDIKEEKTIPRDYLIAATTDLSNYGIIVNFETTESKETGDNPKDEKEFEVVEDENNYEGWEFKSQHISGKETLSYEVRKLLRRTYEGKIVNDVFKPENGPLGYPLFVNFDEMYNYIERNVANILTKEEMLAKLENLIPFKSSIAPIFQRLKEDVKLSSQFFVNFSKAHIKYTSLKQYKDTRTDQSGEEININVWKIFNSNRNDIKNVLIKDWISNFRSKDTNVIDNDGKINKTLAKNYKDQLLNIVNRIITKNTVSNSDIFLVGDLLKNIGIQITADELKSIVQEKTDYYKGKKITIDGVNNFLNFLRGQGTSVSVLFTKLNNGENPFESVTYEKAALENIANIKLQYSKDLIQSAFINVDGNNVYSHQNPSYLTKLVNDLKSGKYIDQHFKDDYFAKNVWLNDIKNNEFTDIDFTYIDGLTSEEHDEGVKYTKMSTKDFEVTSLNMWLGSERGGAPSKNGYYRFPVLSDSPVMAFFKFKKYTAIEVIDHLYTVAKQEQTRIDTVRRENAQNTPKIKNYHTNTQFNFLTVLNGVEGFDITNEQAVKATLQTWMDSEFAKEVESFTRLGILTSESFNDYISNKARNAYGNSDLGLFKEYFFNQVLGNIQLFQILHGDPSFYKSSDLYAGKRNNQVTKPGLKLDSSIIRPNYNSVYVNDIYSPSIEFKESIKTVLIDLKVAKPMIDFIVSQYNDVNSTDAQSYITLDRWKEIQVGLGRWNKKLDKSFNRLKNGKALKEDISLILQPIKPYYFNHEFVNGKIIPTQNKNSEAVLLPQIAEIAARKGNDSMKKLLAVMEAKGIDSIQFNSAVKVGEFGTVEMTDLLDGKVNIIHELSNDSYLVQQETPEHHLDAENLYGTQIRKLILDNLDPKVKYFGDLNGEQVVELYTKLIDENVKEDFLNTASEFQTIERLSDLIRKEVRDRKLGENLEAFADIEKDANGNTRFKYPMYFPTQTGRTEPLLSSIFKNRVTKQKINGASVVLTSNFGFSDDLKIKINEKTKQIEYMEMYMPWWSKDFAPYNDNGEIDMFRIDKSLLDIIGYRIPTEGLYSIKRIKIKGFLPRNSGGIGILPSEITKISGEDFDIDKLYLMIPAFTVENNRAVKIKYDISNVQDMSRAQRDNALIDITKSIWSSSNSFQANVEPGSIERLRLIKSNMEVKTDYASIALPLQQRNIFERNTTGANLIGIFANHNVNHSVAQHFKLKMAGSVFFSTKSKGKKAVKHKLNSISETTDIKNNLISRNIALFLNASVDNAKEPILNDLNISIYTSDILMIMIRTGVPVETALYFLNQPIIKEYMFKYNNSTDIGKDNLIFDQIMDNYSGRYEELTGNEFVPKTKSTLVSDKMLEDITNPIEDSYYIKRQMRTLFNFRAYKSMGEKLSRFVAITRADALGSQKTIAANSIFLDRIDTSLEKEDVIGADAVFSDAAKHQITNTFTKYGIKEPTKILNAFYPYNNLFYNTVKEALYFNKQKELTEKEVNHINLQIFKFYLSNFFNKNEASDLITNLPERLEKYKANLGENQYQFIANLKINPETADIPFKTIVFNNNVSITNEQKDYFIDSWEYMMKYGSEEDKKIGEDLIKYSFFTKGYTFDPTSFSHLIPHQYLREYVNDIGQKYVDEVYKIQDISTDKYGSEWFIDQYVRNFYEESEIVPKISYRNDAITRYEVTENNNLLSFISDAGDNKKNKLVIGFDDLDNPVFRKYVSVKFRSKTRLYRFEGIHTDTKFTGVYNLVSNLGLKGVATEFNDDGDVTSIFAQNAQQAILNALAQSTYKIQDSTISNFVEAKENIILDTSDLRDNLKENKIEPKDDIDGLMDDFSKFCK